MANKKINFLDKFIERIDKIDKKSLESYIVELKKENITLKDIFDRLVDGIILLDGDERVEFINQQAKRILGISMSQEPVSLSTVIPWCKDAGKSNFAPTQRSPVIYSAGFSSDL